MKPVVPVRELGTRIQEHGRIRLGVKTGNAMKSIDTFRFTSPDEEALHQIAELYGGGVRPWSDPKANPPSQFEVITTADQVRVFLPAGGLSIWYELWSAAGNLRRCDGETCEVAGHDEMQSVPCICTAQSKLVCKPKTRINVILPEIRFGGVWRLDTGSWNAAKELPAMEALLNELQGTGLIEALLCVEKQSQTKNGRKRNFIVPRIRLAHSALAVASGQAAMQVTTPAPLELVTAEPTDGEPLPSAGDRTPGLHFDLDDDIVDAEVVEEEESPGIHPKSPNKGLSRATTRLVLSVKDAAAFINIDEDLLRHALARKASKGRTDSSQKLSSQEMSQVIDWATEIADGDWEVEVVTEQPPHVKMQRPEGAP